MMAQTEIKRLFRDTGAEQKFREPMSAHTSLRIGGPADVFIRPRDADSLKRVRRTAAQAGIEVFPLGGGTNLLVKDEGLGGAVVYTGALKSIEIIGEDSDTAVIRAASGVRLKGLLDFALKRGLSGMEGLSGIPGLLGGAIAGNAGAFGFEIKDTLISAAMLNPEGDVETVGKDGLRFEYRKAAIPPGSIILYADFKLWKDSPGDLSERVKKFLAEKKTNQPLGERSAGCVYKNPAGGGEVPSSGGGNVPSAGKLIEDAGLKGMRVGDIEVSRKHANFFINRGKGRADDFLRLMEKVSAEVKSRFGIVLEPEIKIIGR